ncbi:MATE family efflux transporter [Ferrimonas senticii]|uniref:MATE family efflux transporter n=1 Tax=Ferrimonas senticii TaxID=394566 RepID=UPI0004242131|nr:MATE family efflux transporter [Ferrimonas senticii]
MFMSREFTRSTMSLAWPLALNALLMQSMLLIDTLLVAPLGELPLAALGIASALLGFVFGLQMALANGSQLLFSRAVGRGDGLPQAVADGLLIALAFALLLTLGLWLLLPSLAPLLTSEPEQQQLLLEYLQIGLWLPLLNGVSQTAIAQFNAQRQSRIPLKGYLLELPVNAGLSLLLIHGFAGVPALGLAGAAWGSLLGLTLRLAYLWWQWRGNMALRLPWRRHAIMTHLQEVWPVAANVGLLQTGVMLYQLIYSQLALSAYVAIAILMPWLRIGGQFVTAWAHACAIVTSHSLGAQRLQQLPHQFASSIRISICLSALVALAFALLSLAIQWLYPSLQAATYQALQWLAPLYILLPLLRGYNTVHGHLLRALGKTTAVFKINFGGQWLISLPLCALGVLVWDVGVWWAFAIQPLEELIKLLPFRYLARRELAKIAGGAGC